MNVNHDQRRTKLHLYLHHRGDGKAGANTGVALYYHAQQQQQQQPRIRVSHSCMLIPVFFGIWWYYFQRKVSKVFSKLMVKNGREATAAAAENSNNPDAECNAATAAASDVSREDEFSTWQDVMDHNIPDPSVRFVRWTKTGREFRGTARRRAHQVRQTTRTTLRMAEPQQQHNRTASEMTTPMMDAVLLDDDISSQASSSVSGVFSETGTRWQCLQDVGVGVIELCAISPTRSNEESAALSKQQQQQQQQQPSAHNNTIV